VSATPVTGGIIFNDYVINTDNNLVFYRGDVTTDNRTEVYMSTLAVPSVTTRLNVAVGANSDVFEFQVNSDATAVVFRADIQSGRNLLYIVQLDTPGVQTLLSLPASNTAYDVFEFQLTDSGVIYRGDLVLSSKNELYRTEFSSPGTATTLVQMTNAFDVDTFRVSGSNVFYRADPIRSNVSEILYVDSDVPQVTTTLTPFPAATNIENLQAF